MTLQNEPYLGVQPAITAPHVNPPHEQPGHSPQVTSERSCSSSRSTSSSQKGGGERRPTSRKRNECSPMKTNTSILTPQQNARNSPSSKPAPDKKISNDQSTSRETPAPSSKLGKLESVVSKPSVLPPPLPVQPTRPQGLPQPILSQSSSRDSLAKRSTPRPTSSQQQKQEPIFGYQSTPQSQKTVEVIKHDYPDLKIKNSGPAGTPLRKQAIQNPRKRIFTRQPTYLDPMQYNKSGTVTKNARRIWESAVIVSLEWLFEKNMCPPSDKQHATLEKSSVTVFMSRPLRADHTPANEPPWLGKAMNTLPSVEDNILDALTFDPC